jgi:hypothetical protein
LFGVLFRGNGVVWKVVVKVKGGFSLFSGGEDDTEMGPFFLLLYIGRDARVPGSLLSFCAGEIDGRGRRERGGRRGGGGRATAETRRVINPRESASFVVFTKRHN